MIISLVTKLIKFVGAWE